MQSTNCTILFLVYLYYNITLSIYKYPRKNSVHFFLFNPLNAELNPIRHLLALVGARHIVHVSRIRVNIAKWSSTMHGTNNIKFILTPVPCIFFIYNSTNYCTILIFELHIITYDLFLHVSTLIRHHQGTLRAWLKLRILLILIKWNC